MAGNTDAPRKTRSGAIPAPSQRTQMPHGRNATAGNKDIEANATSSTGAANASPATTPEDAMPSTADAPPLKPSAMMRGNGGKKKKAGARCVAHPLSPPSFTHLYRIFMISTGHLHPRTLRRQLRRMRIRRLGRETRDERSASFTHFFPPPLLIYTVYL
jgi:hypothetical protein